MQKQVINIISIIRSVIISRSQGMLWWIKIYNLFKAFLFGRLFYAKK